MEKPIREWLETIADDTIRTEAIQEFERQGRENRLVTSLDGALDYGFSWKEASKGFSYWDDIYMYKL